MAVMPIKTIGDPVLRTEAKKIENFGENTTELINNLIDTLRNEEGLGLAANQIGILQRAAVIDVEEEMLALINPEIIREQGSVIREEGCLSIPGRQGPVPRAESIELRYQDRDGEIHQETFSGLLARVIQHEIDHLNGELFVDKLVDVPLSGVESGEKERKP